MSKTSEMAGRAGESSSSAPSGDGVAQINGNNGVPRSFSLEEPGPAARRPSNEPTCINIFGVDYPIIGRGGTVSAAASTNASRTPTIESGRPGHAELLAAVAAVRDESPGTEEAFSRQPSRRELSQAIDALGSLPRSSSAGVLPTTDAAGQPTVKRT